MNPKELYSPQFKQLETGFLQWLQTLNYSPATIATSKRNIKEFLLTSNVADITTIEQATMIQNQRFVNYLKTP